MKELQRGTDLLSSTEKYLFTIKKADVKKWSVSREIKWLKTVQSAHYASEIGHQPTRCSRAVMRQWLAGS